jgi:hypothetical protein
VLFKFLEKYFRTAYLFTPLKKARNLRKIDFLYAFIWASGKVSICAFRVGD